MFGSFWRIFEPGDDGSPLYLRLLHLDRDGVGEALTILSSALREERSPSAQLVKLLRATNWRPQLVGSVAVALCEPTAEIVDTLWATIDEGSWVGPQLVASASLADQHFDIHAQERIMRVRNIPEKPLSNRDYVLPTAEQIAAVERTVHQSIRSNSASAIARVSRKHMEQGPDSNLEDTAKTIGAMLALLETTQRDWVQTELARPDVGHLLEYQEEDFRTFILNWRHNLTDLVRLRGPRTRLKDAPII